MSLNDKSISLAGNKGVDVHPGVANPTAAATHSDPLASNFVTEPTTSDRGAGAGARFTGDAQAARTFRDTAGVVEGRPGILASTHIDPLADDSNKDDGWANATSAPASGTGAASLASGAAAGAANVATGAAKLAYGVATGNEVFKEAGKNQIYERK